MAQLDGQGGAAAGFAARFSRPLAFALLAEAGATLTMIATFRLASDFWGAAGFAEWVLSRRVLAFLLPVITIGMEIALPRFVAVDVGGIGSRFLAAACLLMTGIGLVLLVLVGSFDAILAGIVFGDSSRHYLLVPVFLLAVGYACHTLLYGYLRGRMEFMLANLVHLIAFGVLPLIVFWLFRESSAQTITVLGVVVGSFAAVALVYILVSTRPPLKSTIQAISPMIAFGSTRAIAALLLMLLFLLPAAIVASRSGIEAGGAVGFAVSAVTIAASAFGPVALVMLPLAASLVAMGKFAELRNVVFRLERLILVFGSGVFILMLLAAPWVAIVVTGHRSPDIELAVKLAAFAAGPFTYFVCVRNVVDACTSKTINSRNVLLAIIVFGAGMLAAEALGFDAAVGIMCSYVFALWVLAGASASVTHKLLRGGPS
jgi:O-antigen/teichoic acid export membrane protein